MDRAPSDAAAMTLAPVGVFDSGVGGLSVLREIRRHLPAESLIYLADQAHVPYGPRPLEQVREFSHGITRFLVAAGAKLVVVACNAASAAALHDLRKTFPGTPFVGMEPAVRRAVAITQTRRVGVLATPVTFQGQLFASVVERFGEGVELMHDTLPGLVQRIEAGDLDGPETRAIINRAVRPMLERGVDTLVLACTHYPFVIPLIEEIAGPEIRVIDPSPAIARQTARLLAEKGLQAMGDMPGDLRLITTGDPLRLRAMAERLVSESVSVEQATWLDGDLALLRRKPSSSAGA